MNAEQLREYLVIIRWSPLDLAQVLGCEEGLVNAWVLGTEDTPDDVGGWLDTIAHFHKAAESQRPRRFQGYNRPKASERALEHVPVDAYYLLRRLGQGPVPLTDLYGIRDEGLVDFLITRGLAVRDSDELLITEAGRGMGEIEEED
ncbi:hypothetical protein GCM10011321_03090 [Youhaiella tibetensis]|uniref:Uncharacterized protein n=1 Tax=Paradevosia tibetensis TaxID=1447062 RepID=A0A5B9DQU1_9HYPH|nr:hypothetical protein [Youhaiella tibetensis]AKR56438.1 hypothetical protein XM25_11660 [Devosia sp. H5989]QEE21486.1 hypothetical protein FNA67_15390 [Youhaiella tibetensis]GGF14608.1 hypothetical protein GCM10011321_03090 [Youhaiella tibetensis]